MIIILIGLMINLVVVLEKDFEIVYLIGNVIFMGGVLIVEGNVIDVVEVNIN